MRRLSLGDLYDEIVATQRTLGTDEVNPDIAAIRLRPVTVYQRVGTSAEQQEQEEEEQAGLDVAQLALLGGVGVLLLVGGIFVVKKIRGRKS